jgi:hypothetical protein
MHFSIRHCRKNHEARIDGPETVAGQCGDFWTLPVPSCGPFVEMKPCKFRALAGLWGTGHRAKTQSQNPIHRYSIGRMNLL